MIWNWIWYSNWILEIRLSCFLTTSLDDFSQQKSQMFLTEQEEYFFLHVLPTYCDMNWNKKLDLWTEDVLIGTVLGNFCQQKGTSFHLIFQIVSVADYTLAVIFKWEELSTILSFISRGMKSLIKFANVYVVWFCSYTILRGHIFWC